MNKLGINISELAVILNKYEKLEEEKLKEFDEKLTKIKFNQ